MIHFQLRSRYIWYSFFSFYHSHFSLGVMDRQGISSSVYNNNDDFVAANNSTDAKMQAQMEEIKALIKSYNRSSSYLRRRSRAHASELPSPARSHRHRHHHQQVREGQELNTNNRSMTSPSPLASSPSDFKASSPTDIRHLCPQEPQEKFPNLKSATSTSYYDLDTDHEISFYGTVMPNMRPYPKGTRRSHQG